MECVQPSYFCLDSSRQCLGCVHLHWQVLKAPKWTKKLQGHSIVLNNREPESRPWNLRFEIELPVHAKFSSVVSNNVFLPYVGA